jgi:hypothetical protein
MKRLIIVLVALFMFSLAFGTYVNADWDKDDVAKLVEKVKKGQAFYEQERVQRSMCQVLEIITMGVDYIIDIKAQICYAAVNGNGKGLVVVPCEAVKKGYPLFAPLMP